MGMVLGRKGVATSSVVPLLAGLLLAAFLRADEAALPDGNSIPGKLKRKDGRLYFLPARRNTPLRLDRVEQVRLPAAGITPVRTASLHRLILSDGRRLTGELLDLDARRLRFRPTWAGTLTLPRSAVTALTQMPGWLTFADDDFETGLKAWKVTGKATRSGKQRSSGKRSLLLSAAGQGAEYTLASALAAGRAGVNVYEGDGANNGSWLVEAEFETAKEPRVVRVVVAGAGENYAVDVPGSDQKAFTVRRGGGWRRLTLEFTPTSLIIAVDGAVLWVSRRQGPGGPLRKVRLVCRPATAKEPARGEVFFDDFALARPVDPLRREPADPGQDELWLRSGDQILGTVTRADRRTIGLRSRFGSRTWSWGDVRGIYFGQQPSPQTSSGEHVRVWVRTGAGPEPDAVTGTVRSLDEHALTLADPVLGDLRIDRGRVRRLRWLFHGQRLELDQTWHHLGRKGKLVPALTPARAEGPSREYTFRLEAAPASARLQLQVVHLKGPADGIGAALRRGELRTEVVVNGRLIDYLNRQVRRSSSVPHRLTLVLPRGALRAGNNRLLLRQTPERETGRYESCGVAGLVVEVPR